MNEYVVYEFHEKLVILDKFQNLLWLEGHWGGTARKISPKLTWCCCWGRGGESTSGLKQIHHRVEIPYHVPHLLLPLPSIVNEDIFISFHSTSLRGINNKDKGSANISRLCQNRYYISKQLQSRIFGTGKESLFCQFIHLWHRGPNAYLSNKTEINIEDTVYQIATVQPLLPLKSLFPDFPNFIRFSTFRYHWEDACVCERWEHHHPRLHPRVATVHEPRIPLLMQGWGQTLPAQLYL